MAQLSAVLKPLMNLMNTWEESTIKDLVELLNSTMLSLLLDGAETQLPSSITGSAETHGEHTGVKVDSLGC